MSPARPLGSLGVAVVFAVALAACDRLLSDLQPDPDSINVKDVVDLARVGDATVLDRADTSAQLVARLPAAATVRTVTFTTSAGSFVLTGTREAVVRVQVDSADSRRRWAARAEIRRDTAASALVSAAVAGYRDTVRVRFR